MDLHMNENDEELLAEVDSDWEFPRCACYQLNQEIYFFKDLIFLIDDGSFGVEFKAGNQEVQIVLQKFLYLLMLVHLLQALYPHQPSKE